MQVAERLSATVPDESKKAGAQQLLLVRFFRSRARIESSAIASGYSVTFCNRSR
jgi:hypothetical protein